MAQFIFATGIENSYPTIALPDGSTKRIDELEKCGHYDRWLEDFRLVKEIGIGHLRYGPPYYRVHQGADRYDWSFVDETFRSMRELGIEPIADLCHFGVPDWIGSFQNPDWPRLFADYARAFAQRYPWVWLYTPVNEIWVTASFSAKYGYWNERGTSEATFVTAIKHLCQANVLAMRAILEVQPEAVFIQSSSSEYFHAIEPGCISAADFLNEWRFLALDLTYGHPITSRIYEYLLDNGMTRDEYHWFLEKQVRGRCVMGNDYYVWNEHWVTSTGETPASGEIFGYYVITHQYFDRYRLPVMHTETNTQDADAAPDWLRKQWANVYRLRQDGIPIIGFTWYSLTDQVDWDTGLREDAGRVNPLGLYDLDRRIRPVGEAYRDLIVKWRRVVEAQPLAGLPTHGPASTASRVFDLRDLQARL